MGAVAPGGLPTSGAGLAVTHPRCPILDDGPTGEDRPCLAPADLRAVLLGTGHTLARGCHWCLPWCGKCLELLMFSGIDRGARSAA